MERRPDSRRTFLPFRIPTASKAPDGIICVLYDWNRHTDAEILLAKFREEDVLAGKLVSADAKLRMLANKATGPKPGLLYNGIELPYEWPPRHLSIPYSTRADGRCRICGGHRKRFPSMSAANFSSTIF